MYGTLPCCQVVSKGQSEGARREAQSARRKARRAGLQDYGTTDNKTTGLHAEREEGRAKMGE